MKCLITHPIEQLPSEDSSFAKKATFRWMGTTFSLVEMFNRDGDKCISVQVAGVKIAETYLSGTRATWIISKEDLDRSAAGASTTFDGSVPSATEKSTSR